MNERIDWCKFFADIEENPSAITPQLTVEQFYEAREHVYGCDTCNNRIERAVARAPRNDFPLFGEN